MAFADTLIVKTHLDLTYGTVIPINLTYIPEEAVERVTETKLREQYSVNRHRFPILNG